MSDVVIYKQDTGVIAIVRPVGVLMGANAARLVPKGERYRIIDDSELPSDRSMRDAWTVDVADLTDGIGEAEQ